MMINDKARGRRRGKNTVQEHADCCGSHTLCEFRVNSNEVVDVEVYRRINVSVCLMCVLPWPEGTLGVDCFATCQMYNMIQTHTWHVRYRFCLIIFLVFTTSPGTSILFWFPGRSNLGLASCFHTFWSCKIKIDAKNTPGSSVFSEHVCFCYLLLTSFFHDNPSLEGRTSTNKKRETFRWKYDMIASKHSYSQNSLQQLHARARTRTRGWCRNRWITFTVGGGLH